MTSILPFPLVAIDIGNSRLKVGLFESADATGLPTPARWLDVQPDRASLDQLTAWLSPYDIGQVSWWIGSVNRPHCTELLDWLRNRQMGLQIALVASDDLPLAVSLARPDMVGIDRLLGAVGANRLREPRRAAVVVDLGTAITVDLVSQDGAFCGGAILPGISMAARALYEFTDLLPLLDMESLAEPPAPVGRATTEAMQSGLFWGAVGGARELIQRMSAELDQLPQVFLTGGAAPTVAPLLAADALYVPHLVLGGIAATAGQHI
jgi:type III pantothenate kinase